MDVCSYIILYEYRPVYMNMHIKHITMFTGSITLSKAYYIILIIYIYYISGML